MGPARRTRSALQEFISWEASGGVALLGAAVVGIVWVNLHASSYHDLWGTTMTLGFGSWAVREDLAGWVNDALMTVFFFVVGLEIKRELVVGELRDRRTAAMPIVAAVGGMVVPAMLFLALNRGTPTARAWGTPVATDIAFVLGVLALLGRRAPGGLRLFLLTLAIADDLGGIVVIAVFYAESVSIGYLVAAAAWVVAVAAIRRHVGVVWVYVVAGVVLWYLVHRSGVHATLAGVVLGMLTPARTVHGRDILRRLEHRLVPWSAFLVAPVFAAANAGVDLSPTMLRDAFGSRVTWGVVVGLVVGKAVGISAAASLALRARVARLPAGVRFAHVVAGAFLGGIGFTVALFIAELSLAGTPEALGQAKVGIIAASLAAAAIGTATLALVSRRALPEEESGAPGEAPTEGGRDVAASGG